MKAIRRILGTQPDYWDFQVVDLLENKHYVFYDGISPSGEQITIEQGAITRKGRGIWFAEIDPDPMPNRHEDILLFLDGQFSWHDVIKAGAEERYVTIGHLSFSLVPAAEFRGGRITKLLRRKRGDKAYFLLAELIPWVPNSEELTKWYETVKAKIDIEALRQAPAKLNAMKMELSRVKQENLVLQEEIKKLRAQRDALLREVARLEREYGARILSSTVTSLLEELKIREVEELQEQIKPTGLWDKIRRKREESPRDEIEKLRREVEELRREIEEVEEGG